MSVPELESELRKLRWVEPSEGFEAEAMALAESMRGLRSRLRRSLSAAALAAGLALAVGLGPVGKAQSGVAAAVPVPPDDAGVASALGIDPDVLLVDRLWSVRRSPEATPAADFRALIRSLEGGSL